MKPTSVIFLVVAVLLIVGGMITCSVARDVALTDNYMLFAGSASEDDFIRHDFSGADISKIELLVSDAHIHIYGGAETAYIEFSGFREGLYTFSAAGKVLSLDEMPDIKSILSLKSGFSFSGMRYFLRGDESETVEKRINVYLPQDAALKILAIEADNCTLHVDELYSQFDVTVKAAKNLDATLEGFRTACSLTLEAEQIKTSLNHSYLHALTVRADYTEVESEELYLDNLTLKTADGHVNIHSVVGLNGYEMDIRGSGKLLLNDIELPLPHVAHTGSTTCTVTAEIGDATLSLVEMID